MSKHKENTLNELNELNMAIFNVLRERGVRGDLAACIACRALATWNETDTIEYGTINRDNWHDFLVAVEHNRRQ